MTMNKCWLATLCSLLIAFQAGAQSLDSVFSKPAGMTDEEMKKAEQFKHHGKTLDTVKAGCEEKELGAAKCDEQKLDTEGTVFKGQFGANLEKHIGKLYGVLFGASGFMLGSGGPQITQKATKGTVLTKEDKKALNKNGEVKNADGSTKAEKKADYCIYAVTGYELIAGMMQTSGQSQTPPTDDLQLSALLSLKQAHKTRRKTATYQAVIYGATSACYITRLAASKGTISLKDPMYLGKMAASAGLTTLFTLKAKKHKMAEDAVDKVIGSLPKAGDCNPWTKTPCFCKEPSSKTMFPAEYEEVCVLNKGNFDGPVSAMGCGVLKDGKMNFDKNCDCKKTNTCFKAKLNGYNPSFNLGANFMNDGNKGYDLLSKGIFDQGAFDAYSMGANANAKRITNKITPGSQPILTASQKKIADDLKDLGPGASAIAAADDSSPPGGGLMNSGSAGLSALSPEIKQKLEAETVSAYKQGGPGFGSNDNNSESEMVMPSLGGETKPDNSTEILSFAEQAISQADVTKTPETPIFDIISHRYRASGWTKLNSDAK